MSESNGTFDQWCKVELFGRQVIVGRVTEETIGGCSFIRVDVPELDAEHPAYTRYLGQAAIYGMTPVSEDLARKLVQAYRTQPIQRYELPSLPAPAPSVPYENYSDYNDPDPSEDDEDEEDAP